MKTNAFVLIFISLLALPETKGHQGLMATLFVQKSAEFYSNSIGIYNSAMDKLPALVEGNKFSLCTTKFYYVSIMNAVFSLYRLFYRQ